VSQKSRKTTKRVAVAFWRKRDNDFGAVAAVGLCFNVSR